MVTVLMQCLIADVEKGSERDQLALAEQQDVIVLRNSQLQVLVVLDLERLVVLREAFVEPSRYFRLSERRIEKKVYVLVIDRAVRIGVCSPGSESDVIDVLARLEISGDIVIDLAVIPLWLERSI